MADISEQIQKHHPTSSSSMQLQRPSHNPPKNLSQNEIQCLYDLLGNNCVTLATAVAQILYGYNNVWKKQACGVLCFIKDYNRRVYYFRLYNLRAKESIYEEITSISLGLDKLTDRFYTFDGIKCKVGINFVDRIEAETFCKNFHDKQADRQKKMKMHQSTNSSMSVMMNGIKPPTTDVIKTPVPSSTTSKKFKSKTTGNRKKKNDRPVITLPIESSLVHVMHVGHEGSFVTEQAQKQLFEEVLTNMHMSPEEETYIRKTIKNTNNGLEKLFTKSSHNETTQRQPISNDAPEIPPRTYLQINRNNRNRIPHQDISIPTSIYHQTSSNYSQFQNTYNTSVNYEQSTAPAVPPRPPRHVLDKIKRSSKTSRPPPPPIPTDSLSGPPPPPPIPTDSPGGPPPPPPPMPNELLNPKQNPNVFPSPTLVSEQMTNKTPTSSSLNSERDGLLQEICKFDTVKLKPASQRPIIEVKSTENTANLDTQRTLEENIREILEKRRLYIKESNDEEDESDPSDEEWDA